MINQLFFSLPRFTDIYSFSFQIGIGGISNPLYSGYMFRVIYAAVKEELVLLFNQCNPEFYDCFDYIFQLFRFLRQR